MGDTASARPAGPGDIAAVGHSLGRAFRDDPISVFMAPALDDDERARRLTPFYGAVARIHLKTASVWIDPDRRGAALWAPPGRWRTRPLEALGIGPSFLRLSGSRGVRVLRSLAHIEKAHPRQPHWYLAVLGTDPDHQGRGVGSAVMAPVLGRCDDEGLPAYLESSKEENVPFYERHGFRVQQELRLPHGAPSVWAMWREPRP